jgi:superfamily II DNA or RNA helicase
VDKNGRLHYLNKRLAKLDRETSEILSEIALLESTDKTTTDLIPAVAIPLGRSARPECVRSPDEKIALFIELFRCRESVYPTRWENANTGKHGYSPVCSNEWKQGICQKPKIKCAECAHQAFEKFDKLAAESHLKGLQTMGTYAIREDDTCTFLACDFDKEGWQADVAAYRQVANLLGIDVGVERSRSGNGAHAWIFFQGPVSARNARMLGTLILARCQEVRHQMDFGSFDRLFPNQDVLPSGGFGNLIALPLQKKARAAGNTLFLDDNLEPFPDQQQWAYLSGIRRLSDLELHSLLALHLKPNHTNHTKRANTADLSEEDPLLAVDEGLLESGKADPREYRGALAGHIVEVTLGAQLQIPLLGMPSRLITKLKRTASFANPAFYKEQRMRMSSYPPIPRFIFSGTLAPDVLLLPRGCFEKVKAILAESRAIVVIRDDRLGNRSINADFKGKLNAIQEKAVAALTRHDMGVLVAPPGSGKTVMGCYLIARRKVTTLVLVHRQPLLDQWSEKLQNFLGLGKREIGILGGSKCRLTGKVDLAMIQSLTRMENVHEIAENYAQIIIDEAHHIPAASFEGIMKMLPSRYVVGLTATPYRKDGLQKILFQQCGPARHSIESADGGSLRKTVMFRETGFKLPKSAGVRPAYQEILQLLTMSAERNQQIVTTAMEALTAKRFPVVISDRKNHLELLEQGILHQAAQIPELVNLEVVRLDGDVGKRQRQMALKRIEAARNDGRSIIIFATGSLIGEGFDLPALDTLVLATPLSFKGRMIQYAGRLHRVIDGKEDVVVHDFVDVSEPMLMSMYRKRAAAYRNMGYELEGPASLIASRSKHQVNLFGE